MPKNWAASQAKAAASHVEGTRLLEELSRREFARFAAALGATAAWCKLAVAASNSHWRERPDLYPQGVASGDPDHHSVLLWTRRPFGTARPRRLTVEVALDPEFRKVVAVAGAKVSPESDWTCRVLAGGLKPSTIYWYRFTDREGGGSRIGRTFTAPPPEDTRAVRFAFVSCQSVNEGAQNALRRMVWEDRQAPAGERLGFLLHLGDFIYEIVEYPDETPHRYDRTVFDIGRVPDGRKVGNFHVPTNLAGYRMVYQAYIADPDIQEARAWLPFVCIGDNHEFSWQGWQSFIKYGGEPEPAQALRAAANQAWWEYIPSRVRKASGPGLDQFDTPAVINAPITAFDADGFGDEINNRIAIGSMTSYRAFRYGQNVELILTDFHSYSMEDLTSRPEADAFTSKHFPILYPEEALQILDGGRAYGGGNPPDRIPFGTGAQENFRKDEPPVTILGHVQKAWLKQQLASSKATWKIWAATNGTLEMRTDPQNLPGPIGVSWPAKGYAVFAGGDFSTAYRERAEIYDHVRDSAISGFAIISGDRHAFWAGYAAKSLPPAAFEPVGISFITGSVSAAGYSEALEHDLKGHPLRPLYTVERANGLKEATLNLALHHGTRSALEYAHTGDIARARALSNPNVAPHVEFVDMGGHGYSVVTADARSFRTEFVCVPRPVAPASTLDGGPIRYRVTHEADLWKNGERPRLRQEILEGDPKLSI